MKKLSLSFIFSCIAMALFAQTGVYDLTTVPDAVKKNANMITRKEAIQFEVKDIDRAYLTVDKIFTVLNENGKDVLDFHEFTNKYIDLTDAEIRVLDAAGKTVSKFKKSEMTTVANGDGLIDEGKVTFFSVPAPVYPITVQFKYEVRYKGTMMYPQYTVQSAGEGVQESSFTLKVPASLDIRYKEKNISLAPVVKTVGEDKFYEWTVSNRAPLESEPGAVSFESRYPTIQLAPNRFKLYDYDGEMSTWKAFGNWEYGLLQGLNALSPERKTFFTTLVKDAGTDKEKVRMVYQYLQKNFRYVSIQLGIGGYRPFAASFTDEKKYGDCKGLSFYTHSVLEALGIKSYVALINAGYNKEPADINFPCNVFNHMILCVPMQKDTVWLECTSNTNDFGVLGNFTENRNALLVTPEGGILVATPRSKSSDNRLVSHSKVQLAEDASGESASTWQTSGEYTQDIIHYIRDENRDNQKKFLVNYYGFQQPDDFSVLKADAAEGAATEIRMTLEKVPEFIAGNKMFLRPRLYKLINGKLPKAENRQQDYFFECPFQKVDTTAYRLPVGYIAEAMPAEKKLQCRYGSYISKCWYSAAENTLYSTATLELFQHRIPAADYAAVKTFFDDVLKNDAQRMVIKKQ